MKIPIMSYAINLTFQLLVWLVPGEKFYGLGTGFQFQTIPVPLYVLNPMGLLCIPSNGGRDLQIINWFEESLAGRQCNGRQPDFRHGRPLDI